MNRFRHSPRSVHLLKIPIGPALPERFNFSSSHRNPLIGRVNSQLLYLFFIRKKAVFTVYMILGREIATWLASRQIAP